MTRILHSARVILVTALVLAGGYRPQLHATPAPVPSRDAGLRVDVWTDRGDGSVYRPGDEVFVYFHASDDCYLSVYDIDTEGRVRLLFPQYPDDGFVYGGMTYRIPEYYDRVTLRAAGPRGIEYIHAVATREPRLFRRIVREHRYEFNVDPVTDDPFIAINRINARLISPYYIHATATTSFFIEGRVWYPRYMCNSCHNPARIRHFDPYRSVCGKYSVIVAHDYDYWWSHDYHPSVTRFVFSGPFWRFEYRSGRLARNRHYSHLDCAHGFSNYRPIRPPARAYADVERKSPRDTERRTRERSYTTVRYDEVRTRTNGADIRSRDAERSSQPDIRSRDAERSSQPDIRSRDAERSSQPDIRSRDAERSSQPDIRSRDRDATTAPPSERIRTEGTRGEGVRKDAGTPTTGGNSDEPRSRERVDSSPPRSSGAPAEPQTNRTRESTIREDAKTAPRNSEPRPRQSVEQPRERERSSENSRNVDREPTQSPRQESSNAAPRDRSPRAPEQRSR